MYDLRNRFYSPDLGRFLQPDPIGFKGDGSNLYRYCGNDWANRTDPMGLDPSVKLLNDQQVNDPVQKEFDKATQDFAAHGVEVQQQYNKTPQLKALNLQNNIQKMINVVKNKNEMKSFHDPKFITQVMTRIIKAFMGGRIQMAPPGMFAQRNSSRTLASSYDKQAIYVNPNKAHVNPDSLPIDLAHEGTHLTAKLNPKWGNHMERDAYAMGHDMGNALSIPQRPIPSLQDIRDNYGYPDF